MPNEYSQSQRNRVRQIRSKAAYDRATVHGVLDSALYASVAFVQDGNPVVVPMLFGRDGETLARGQRILDDGIVRSGDAGDRLALIRLQALGIPEEPEVVFQPLGAAPGPWPVSPPDVVDQFFEACHTVHGIGGP